MDSHRTGESSFGSLAPGMPFAVFVVMETVKHEALENIQTSPFEEIPMVTTITFKDLVTSGKGPIAVEFMSYRCEYCRTLDPVLRQAARILSPKMTTFKVNIITETDLASRFKIEGTPTLVMFLNGKIMGQSTGPHPSVENLLAVMQAPFPSLQ